MEHPIAQYPAVMSFAGLDPTGGAGLQADIETVVSLGGHALPVITAIAVQDTSDVKSVTPIPALEIIAQARAVLEDIPVAAFKVGLVGSVEAVEAINGLLVDHPGVPLVLDPVCASGAGHPLLNDDEIEALVTLLFPRTTVLTPNIPEARLLAPEADSPTAGAQQLLSYGCQFVLVTGTHSESEGDVVNRLYSNMRQIEIWRWKRLPGSYHGSGCTLASAIATHLAHGVEPLNAIGKAQEFTWNALNRAFRPGRGQLLPNRLHWAR
jgi:hydroxymethylpyrimidine/phosphomethylpyrimidine kinase